MIHQHASWCTDGRNADRIQNHATGITYLRCQSCRASEPFDGPTPEPESVAAMEPPARFVLECLDCGRALTFHSPAARVPLCDHCKRRRRTKTNEPDQTERKRR